jgi:ribosomal protein S18 acetylase RimI-like enzyme
MSRIVPADTPQLLETVRALLVEYGDWLQAKGMIYPRELRAFRDQLALLPGCFAPPDGCLLVGMHGKQAAGCVAIRKLSDEICEMKRLYVKPALRGMSVGRALAEAIIAEAKKIGYTRMRVHTLRSMVEASSLYTSLDFAKISPYEETPIEDAVFMELPLGTSRTVVRRAGR